MSRSLRFLSRTSDESAWRRQRFNQMDKAWPKELTSELGEIIAYRISSYNVGVDPESGIGPNQKLQLENALREVFRDPNFCLDFPATLK